MGQTAVERADAVQELADGRQPALDALGELERAARRRSRPSARRSASLSMSARRRLDPGKSLGCVGEDRHVAHELLDALGVERADRRATVSAESAKECRSSSARAISRGAGAAGSPGGGCYKTPGFVSVRASRLRGG
ncbi:hypothetical protein HJD18_16655 [Thermoleophilia bacterium SCSIO 60948]|nr:hypothetical protein HJD18_16655 [Thermoleophilia bacterium SCSIO 60948]